MKIVCLGDSNTWGFDPRGFFGGRYEHPWPEILQDLTGCGTVNLGMNGRELPGSDPAAARLMRLVSEALSSSGQEGEADRMPGVNSAGSCRDVLIILLGTNDLLNINYDILEEMRRRIGRLLYTVTAELPGHRVLLLTPPECPELELWDPGLYSRAIPLYREMARRYSVELLELAEWKLPLSFDGVHLAEEGHRLLAEKLVEVLGG